ncbi:MAG: DUF3343 domain-containing protein [Oscillospiraceae bacterium]|nr:DUF3343 domain-containing protein [Oscillospiraceae bacterium]
MQYSLILCRSLTYAQRAAHTLERAGVTATVRKAPQGASDRGCTYAVKLRASALSRALRVLDRAGVPYGKRFDLNNDGTLREVEA